jgi:hypothetical protein
VTAYHWSFPLTLDSTGHPRLTEQDSLDHIRDQVQAALLTRVGQGTPLRPQWGTVGLAFRQLPLDTDALVEQIVELVPGAAVHIDQLPDLIDEGLVRLNVYVSEGG